MPIHDWTRVDAGLFHDFHQGWISALCGALNLGGLPSDYFALVEKPIKSVVEDFLVLSLSPAGEAADNDAVALSAVANPPRTRLIQRDETALYADKANCITVRHRHGDVVAVIEIVSPGNKGSRAELRTFVEKTTDLIRQKVHLLMIDLSLPARATRGAFIRPSGTSLNKKTSSCHQTSRWFWRPTTRDHRVWPTSIRLQSAIPCRRCHCSCNRGSMSRLRWRRLIRRRGTLSPAS